MDSGTLEIGQLSSEEGHAMNATAENEQYPETTRSLDGLREMRLLALLGDLIDEQGKTRAAETLGVSPRTLTRFEESRRLTPTLAGALERHLLEGGGSAAATQRHRLGMLEDGLKELERMLQDGLAALRKEAKAADARQTKALTQLQERVAALESAAPGVGSVAAGNGPVGDQAQSGKPVVGRPRRDYYDLVTADPEPSEDLVYGDAATAVIVQWREARDAVGRCRDALDRLNARERVLVLEIELIEQHELTLPPATYPWDRGDRRQEVRRRAEYLDGLRAARNRLKLRRFFTFGLWRN